jgi:Tol biopolymer transport system component
MLLDRVAVGALCLALALAVAGCADDDPAPLSEQPPASTTLVYVDRTDLVSYDLESGETEIIVSDTPSADVAVSSDGDRYVVVKENSPKGTGPEGFRDPVLLVSELDGEPVEMGPGRSPTWSPDGEQLAAIVEAEGYQICGATGRDCFTADRVGVYDAAGGADQEATSALGANRWTIVGWMDDHVLGLGADGKVTLGEPGDAFAEVEQLDLSPSEVWGISPVERTILVVEGGRAYFLHTDGQPASSGTQGAEIALDGGRLGDGTWSPDGDTVAAARLDRRASDLVVIDVGSGDVTDVLDSEGAQGNVVWSPDASSFSYVRVDPSSRGRLQAVLCTTDLECEPLFSWKEGVRLLALF